MISLVPAPLRFWMRAFCVLCLASIFVPVSALGDAWDADNAPSRFGLSGSLKFAELPTEGTVTHRPWVGHSWKERKGGIAYRWQTGTSAWDYTPHSSDALMRLSEKDLTALSPAEKFDIFAGRDSYPTVWVERERNARSALSWYGLCHGWALSATLFREPSPVVMTSPSGKRIPFGSADVKALLAYYAGEALFSRRQFVGLRCNADAPTSAACRDMNAGAFHVLLANEIGREKRSFVVELSADEEIWNKPVLSFSSKVESRRKGASSGAAPGTSEEVTVRTSVTYVHNTDPAWSAQPDSDSLRTYIYRYRLELNPGGIVVGGSWLQSGHPDFAWTLLEASPLASLPKGTPLERLAELYEASTGDFCASRGVDCADVTPTPPPSGGTEVLA